MPVTTAIAVASLVVSAVGVGASIYESQQAQKSQQAALQAQQTQQQFQAAQEKRQAIRQSRISYAAAQQNAENQGAGMSSGSEGGLASIKSQLNENLSFLDDQASLARQAGYDEGQANIFKSRAETFGEVANVGMKVFGSSSQIASVFSGMGGPTSGASSGGGATSWSGGNSAGDMSGSDFG